MSLSPQFLDELRARTTLSALVGRTVKLVRAGREYKACCPFHNEKTPSFWVNDDKGFYHCFGCGAHGDAIRWMTDQRGLGFIDAVKELAEAAGMQMPAPDPRAAEKAERAKGLHEACADAAAWYADQLWGVNGAEARAVLERRGIRAETARAFGLGYAPDNRRGIRDALKDYGDRLLIEAGLLIEVEGKDPYDRFRGRLMIPIRDPRGRVIAFGGRIIGDGEPKYLNSPETPLFDKGRQLYNLDRASAAARKAGRIVAVEGYMDVIALAQAGFDEAVAPLGTAMTEHQLDRLWRMADVPILCFDGDGAGQKAAIRAATRALPMLAPGRSLSFVTLPQGQDPDDLVRSAGPAAFEALLAKPEPLVERLWRHELAAEPLNTPEQRAGLKRRLSDHARAIGDRGVGSEYLAEFRNRCDTHFAPPRRAFTPRQPGRQPGRGVKGKPWWTPPDPPPTEESQRVKEHGIDRVLAKAVLGGLIRHPAEIARHLEVLGSLARADTALARLFEAVIDVALEDQALDTARLRTILATSGLDQIAGEMLRADGVLFSFNRPVAAVDDQSDATLRARVEDQRRRAVADLGEAIAILAAGPRIEQALAEATATAAASDDPAAFDRQQALLRESMALKARLANLMGSDKDD
ncbi:DNA primase [Sphingomonas sp. CJ99]